MKVGSIAIKTPIDDRIDYDPDWRYQVALAVVNEPKGKIPYEYSEYLSDRWIRDYIAYLTFLRDNPTQPLPRRWFDMRAMTEWYRARVATAPKFRLESLLLTPVSYKVIAQDMGDVESAAPIYERYGRMFLDIRDDNGNVNTGLQPRVKCALPSGQLPDHDTEQPRLWAFIAATLGYPALMSSWMYVDAHGFKEVSEELLYKQIWVLAQGLLLQRVVRGSVSNQDLTMVMAGHTEWLRVTHELKISSTAGNIANTFAAEFLGAFDCDVLLKSAGSVDEMVKDTRNVQLHLQTQQKMAGVKVVDHGKGATEAELKQALNTPFK